MDRRKPLEKILNNQDLYISNLTLQLQMMINKYASVLSAGTVYYTVKDILNRIEIQYYKNLRQQNNLQQKEEQSDLKKEKSDIIQD